MKHIVVIGGGFAGINFVRNLRKCQSFQITLVDRNNYNFFPPLLFQVATGFIEPSNISYPFRRLFRRTNVRFRLGEFKEVDTVNHKVVLSNGSLGYDLLVFCTGAETNFFGNENVKKNSLPMKTIDDALELRNHLLQRLEEAMVTDDLERRKKLLTVVVAGAGPTGVEVAGTLAEIKRSIIAKDYPETADKGFEFQLCLIDGAPFVLTTMEEPSRDATHRALAKLGVEVKLNVQVTNYIDDAVMLSNGERIASKTLVWAAGVSASKLAGIPDESFGKGRRLIVDQFNKVKDCEDIYAVGDTCVQTSDARFPNGHPQVAQVALQQGKNLAHNVSAMGNGGKLRPFTYRDKGTMAIIGWNKAVVDLPMPKLHIKGFFAWFMWLVIHLLFLVNFRNRIKTLYNWIGAYWTRDQSLRMIFRPRFKDH
jgi:NADH dehydrogenase